MKRALSLSAVVALCIFLAAPAAAQELRFHADLTGRAEVPPVATDAFGSCDAVLNEAGTTLQISCDHTVPDAIAAHIHTGFPGVAGPVLFGLGDPDSPITATWDLSQDDLVRLLAGGLYVNVHSPSHPGGEIRGQLVPAASIAPNVRQAGFGLTGAQQVPAVTTDATGACFLTLVENDDDPEDNELRVRCTHDVENATAIRIHSGAVGEEGPVVFNLGDADSPIDVTLNPTAAQLDALFDGDLYVNVTSTAHPQGEIRGQLAACLEGDRVICLQDDRFRVEVDWATQQDSGDGHPVFATEDSANFWFFRPGNLELLVKVLDGCPVNDHFWVFFAAVTNVAFDVTVTDTLTGRQHVYSNALGNPACSTLDTTAFPCD